MSTTAPYYARYTLRFHLPAEVLIGLFSGVVQLADLVLRKTLAAPAWMVAFQTSVPVMMFLLAMVWRDLLVGMNRQRLLLLTGVLGKGLLVAVAFIVQPGPFLAVVILFALVDSAYIPVRNAIFRANYDVGHRGRIFGTVTSVMCVATVAANLGAAWLMDHWAWSYRILFPAAGIVGFGAHVIYARVRVRGSGARSRRVAGPSFRRQLAGALPRSFRTMVRILRENPAFRAYERNFFLYGLAFLTNLPLVVLLITDELQLDYTPAAVARYASGPVAMILFSPLAGRLLDRTSPSVMMAGGSTLLAVHSFLLVFAGDFWMLLLSYVLFGIAMTAVNVCWNLGPVHFAPSGKEAEDYMAVHVALTGLRGVLGPVLALGALKLLGLHWGFAVTSGLYLTSGVLMWRLSRRE